MKATGIVRKIDDLGRVVIPKEIRKSLRIREGDPIEIFVEKNGEIVLKRYSPMGDLYDIATKYVETLAKTSEYCACVTDTQSVIAVYGIPKNEYLSKDISEHVAEVIDERAIWSTMDEAPSDIIRNDKVKKYSSQIIAPIICDADAIGSVILFSVDPNKKITNVEYKLVQSAAAMLSRQIEP